MKRTTLFSFSVFLIVGLLSSRLGSAASFEFITPEKRDELVQQFAKAHSPTLDELKKPWTCDMYGVRTNLQIKRSVRLYDFVSNGDLLKNSGNHPIHEYRFEDSALVGNLKTLSDKVKILDNGLLIAELSSHGSEQVVVAYSVCK